jgi:hypothetical protein
MKKGSNHLLDEANAQQEMMDGTNLSLPHPQQLDEEDSSKNNNR